jgi:hydrogenase expression/formation protein HypC
MCLAVPGRVVAVEGMSGRVDFGGVECTVLLQLLPDVRVGDWVLAHAGFAIQRLDAALAAETLALLGEAAVALAPPPRSGE